jgi:putative SOS response-associated peptidase YedK
VHDPALLQPLLKPCDPDLLELYEVSPKVNSPKNNFVENIRPLKT